LDPAPPTQAPKKPDFSSSHTSNFPALLAELGISLAVSTYQAGKLILLRAKGEELNTHFRHFASPMGIAWDGRRLALGTRGEVWDFRNQPSVAARLEPAGKHDAAFLPRRRHYTGDIRIHEIAWIGDELWAANTRFSCLCTFDRDHSFVPRWKPPFITTLAAEDRCHLNGLAVIDGRIKYVTCLGATDVGGGWRANKADGGLLLDVPSGEAVLQGLSMPHSPRFYGGQHWLLESGHGALVIFHPKTGERNLVAHMPGFTRGMDFYGPYAFIGLSQVRETATFSGIPLVEKLQERTCGIWVIDLRTGATVAFLKFEGVVQEIFAVQVLPGIRWPELINEAGPDTYSSFLLPGDEGIAFTDEPERKP
jgi:uncharacterized protein (TIGR03032 family)